jgi:hypothetical protein
VNTTIRAWEPSGAITTSSKMAFHIGTFLIALLILFSRRPDAILNAQFYAEDGTFWYADAYHHSWHCLFMSEQGYLHTVPRLVALFALIFPLALAPFVMNLIALFFQILPINFFLSSRFNSIPLSIRVLGGLLYLAVPNSFEIHANATNIQWHLALLACLVILANSPSATAWKIFDASILVLASVDSPLGIPLVALVAGIWWIRREKRAELQLLALVPGTMIEISVLLFSQTRRLASNGANLTRLGSILGGQVFMSSILGVRTLMQFHFGHMRYLLVLELCATFIGLAVVIYALLFAPTELKLFILFSASILAMALHHPLATMEPTPGQWELLRIPGFGNRYYFFPMLAFFACLIWMVTNTTWTAKLPRRAALLILLLSPIGILRDWRYKPFVDFNFPKYVAMFERAAPGTRVVIPTNPIWTDWTMELVKR